MGSRREVEIGDWGQGTGDRRKSHFVLGVSGVMGSGKSMLCEYLRDRHGFFWIEADAIVHSLYRAGQPGYKKIKEYFGEQFAGKKEVLRGRLRRFVLGSPQKLWILNKLMHSLITHEVNKKIVQLKRENKKSIKEAEPNSAQSELKICIEAFYFEPQDLGKLIDKLFIVSCPDEKILMRRLGSRKIPKAELKKFLYFQQKNLPKFGEKVLNVGLKGDFLRQIEELIMPEHQALTSVCSGFGRT